MPTIQCLVCKSDNESTRTTCVRCQTALPPPAAPAPAKRRSRRGANRQPDPSTAPRAAAYNREVTRVYRLCLIGVVPFLVAWFLGPLSRLCLSPPASVAGAKRAIPSSSMHATPVRVVFLIGLFTGILNWIGLTLMILGLRT